MLVHESLVSGRVLCELRMDWMSREYIKHNQMLYIESVLSTPAKREDVIELQKELDRRLQMRQARETGICPIREELYAQCFDELIRQITIACSNRGLLLVRVRDEMRMTIQAYQYLYESSIAYGMRKALQGEQRKKELESTIKNLEGTCNALSKEVSELEQEIIELERNDKAQKEKEEKAHQEELNKIKLRNSKFKEQLEAKLTGK